MFSGILLLDGFKVIWLLLSLPLFFSFLLLLFSAEDKNLKIVEQWSCKTKDYFNYSFFFQINSYCY